MQDAIKLEKVSPLYEQADAFVLVAMGHGGSKRSFHLADGHQIDLEDQLVQPFDGENWPAMIRKPKVFLFHCCRGKGGLFRGFMAGIANICFSDCLLALDHTTLGDTRPQGESTNSQGVN